ncbi:hypothetical protein LPJ59_000659 [Coemansia sp. RSA 2399]|nr:hypothetical protein LPJ59_000659 [Coemansia sp. RSA 2399]KAJ1907779.1 hypothetical protein LPJ81_000542 [Coemansia sp. IMI 209127]
MVKLFSGLFLAASLVQCAYAHMSVISPPPRSGIIANELQKPCGGANTLTTNVTTVSDSVPLNFVLEPLHGTGNIILSYFTDPTVTNSSVSVFMESTDVPKAGQYEIPVTFDNYGLQNGQAIVVQAVYNGTDSGETEEYYACFDIKLSADASTSSGSPDAESNGESGGEDGIDSSSEHKSSAMSLLQSGPSMTKLALGTAISLFAAAGFF